MEARNAIVDKEEGELEEKPHNLKKC